MTGIATANILNTSAGVDGFSGAITGLTTANMLAGTNGNVLLGLASAGPQYRAGEHRHRAPVSNIDRLDRRRGSCWLPTNSVNVNLHGNDLHGSSSLDLLVTGGGNNGHRDGQHQQRGWREHLRHGRELHLARQDQRPWAARR